MRGLQLAREYYNSCRPLLMAMIPELMAQAAVGLAGEGSECFGLDDEISRDHDFGACFCIWLPDDLIATRRAQLENAIMALPDEFQGWKSRMKCGGGRVGAIGIRAFYNFFTGLNNPPVHWQEWLAIPEDKLAASVNGEVFEDNLGQFSQWREKLRAYYPEDVRLKKIAARLMLMAQSGQYNLPRSLRRGDNAAALLACAKFAEAAISLVFLLNKCYMPYYKLAPRILPQLPVLGKSLHNLLNHLASSPVPQAQSAIEQFCDRCAILLHDLNLSSEMDYWLWRQGPAVARNINNQELRARNLLMD